MNKILQLITSRINGELVCIIKHIKQGVREFDSYKGQLDEDLFNILKNNLGAQLSYYHRVYFLSKFVRKYRIGNLPEDDLCAALKEVYFDNASGCLNFGGVKFFVPETAAEKEMYFAEFGDMMLPYLTDNPNVLDYFYIDGPYELGSVRLDSGDVVIDCGANMGSFAAFTATRDCKVYAFEPMPVIIDKYLSVTSRLNNDSFMICPYALSDKTGTARFSQNMDNLAASAMSDEGEVIVKTITLDDYVNENNLASVDFIKADIEGAERLLLKGAKNTIKTFKPKLSICKYHFPDDPEVLKALILDACPDYKIEEKYKKIYAYVP